MPYRRDFSYTPPARCHRDRCSPSVSKRSRFKYSPASLRYISRQEGRGRRSSSRGASPSLVSSRYAHQQWSHASHRHHYAFSPSYIGTRCSYRRSASRSFTPYDRHRVLDDRHHFRSSSSAHLHHSSRKVSYCGDPVRDYSRPRHRYSSNMAYRHREERRVTRGRRSASSRSSTARHRRGRRKRRRSSSASTRSRSRASRRHRQDDRRRHRRRASSSSLSDRGRRERRRDDNEDSHRRKRRHHRSTSSTTRTGSVVTEKDGHLVCRDGAIIADRYQIVKVLGEGTFGRVVKVDNLIKGGQLALKVIKNVKKYREAAELEINVLRKMDKYACFGRELCIRMLDWFNYHGHVCLSFEVLGKSIYDFQKENNYNPYPIDHVHHMGFQLCSAVKFLHDIKLTHTDLKPENILLVNSEYDLESPGSSRSSKKQVRVLRCPDIRVIDFGSATFDHEQHSTIVSTRHYRALEVILELGWSQPCDVWSIGCILFEMYRGHTLFQTHDNAEHLAMMQRILGDIPDQMVAASRTRLFRDGRLCWNSDSSSGRYVRANCRSLRRCMLDSSDKHARLLRSMQSMLTYEPSRRITLAQALKQDFFEGDSTRPGVVSNLSPSR